MKKLICMLIGVLLLPSYVFADLNADLLQHAIHGNNSEVQKVLARGADVNATQRGGRTALYHAVLEGHTEVVKTLLGTKGIDVNKALDGSGWTPLHVGIEKRRVEIIKLLLAAGADVNKADNSGNTPLHLAASMHVNSSVVKILLEVPGIEINKRNKDGKTPFDVAADWQTEEMLKNAAPESAEGYLDDGMMSFDFYLSGGDLTDIEDAIFFFSKAIELNPNYAEAYSWRALCYEYLENHEQALKDYKTAARLGDKGAQDKLKKKGIQW